jgi:protoporphyrinogen oxidase
MKKVAIVGAGPAGLTAGYLLSKENFDITIFEKDPVYVGGISRTEKYKGFHFDIGGHRFFSKSAEVENFWTEVLGDEMLQRPRKSRIFYKGKFYSYPLKAMEALGNLGIGTSFLCISSYFKAQMFPVKNPDNLEDWVTNQFGKRLFRIFFKTYTEKVWGMDCKDISADWAAQRIKGLKLSTAIINALKPAGNKKKNRSEVVKTLIDSFRYPKYGPGQMWEKAAADIQERGGKLVMNTGVTALHYNKEADKKWTVTYRTGDGPEQTEEYDIVISTMPVRELIRAVRNPKPQTVTNAAESLKYRDFLTVVLIMNENNIFDDNWIYIHSPEVKVGRIQNFKSWSPYMVPDPKYGCYGLEYFCFEGDGLWTSSDNDLIELGKKEMEKIGLANAGDVIDGCVVRQPKAYPVYDDSYRKHMEAIREYLSDFEGLYLTGRNGMHKYNNQDHSMMTAMLAAKNIIAGHDIYNLWNVNEDAEYHEAGEAGADDFNKGRDTPKKVQR